MWPWLAQPGYGRAGWYSYDCRYNSGGKHGAGQIRTQTHQPGARDRARMMPGAGFDLVQIEDGHYFVVCLSDPGSFSTERRMLLKIKARAEHAAQPGLARHINPGSGRHRAGPAQAVFTCLMPGRQNVTGADVPA